MYGLILLILLLVSGAILELPDYFNPLLNKLSPLYKADKILSVQPDDKPRISVDLAVNQAVKKYPQAKLRWIETPSSVQDAYNVRFYQDGEPSMRFPKTTVWIDQYSGKVLGLKDPVNESSGDVFLS